MLKTGQEHVESLRDGRVVHLGSERIDDVTTHPTFRNAVRTVAMLYDMKAASARSPIQCALLGGGAASAQGGVAAETGKPQRGGRS